MCHVLGVPSSSWAHRDLRENTGIDPNIVCSRVGAPRYPEGIPEAPLPMRRGRGVGMPNAVVARQLHYKLPWSLILQFQHPTQKVRVFTCFQLNTHRSFRRRKLAWICHAPGESRARPHRHRCCRCYRRFRWQHACKRWAEPSLPQLQCGRCLSLVLSGSERICQQQEIRGITLTESSRSGNNKQHLKLLTSTMQREKLLPLLLLFPMDSPNYLGTART